MVLEYSVDLLMNFFFCKVSILMIFVFHLRVQASPPAQSIVWYHNVSKH